MIWKEKTGLILKYVLGISIDCFGGMRKFLDEAEQMEFTLLYIYTTAGSQDYCSTYNQ